MKYLTTKHLQIILLNFKFCEIYCYKKFKGINYELNYWPTKDIVNVP